RTTSLVSCAFFLLLLFSTALTPSCISTLSLHDALPISSSVSASDAPSVRQLGDGREQVLGVGMLGRVDDPVGGVQLDQPPFLHQDRKSTRLNSSHVKIPYAVFCLKKKKNYVIYGCLILR